MGYFDNMSDAQVFDKSKYFQEGQYLVELKKTELKSGHKGESFVIETSVLGAHSDEDNAPEAGETAAHVWNASKEMSQSTLMQFLCALQGVSSPKALDDAKWSKIGKAVFEKNRAAGTVMYLEVFNTKTKAGNDFTVHRWQRVAEDADFERFGVDPGPYTD